MYPPIITSGMGVTVYIKKKVWHCLTKSFIKLQHCRIIEDCARYFQPTLLLHSLHQDELGGDCSIVPFCRFGIHRLVDQSSFRYISWPIF